MSFTPIQRPKLQLFCIPTLINNNNYTGNIIDPEQFIIEIAIGINTRILRHTTRIGYILEKIVTFFFVLARKMYKLTPLSIEVVNCYFIHIAYNHFISNSWIEYFISSGFFHLFNARKK